MVHLQTTVALAVLLVCVSCGISSSDEIGGPGNINYVQVKMMYIINNDQYALDTWNEGSLTSTHQYARIATATPKGT